MKLLRWVAVPLACLLAWYATFIVGFIVAASVPCPPDLIVSGACTAWWHDYVIDALVVSFSGIAGFLAVLSAALVAPLYKRRVAWLAFTSGCVVALYFVLQPGGFRVVVVAAFFSAALSGLLAIWRTVNRLGSKMLSSNPLQRIAPKGG